MDFPCTQQLPDDFDTTFGYEEEDAKQKKQVGVLQVDVMPALEIHQHDYPVFEGDNILGRHENCDIFIPNGAALSKKHACFEAEGSTVFVYDCGSSNKTKLNGVKLKPNVRYALSDGDRICFANIKCTYKQKSLPKPVHNASNMLLAVDTPDSSLLKVKAECGNVDAMDEIIPESQPTSESAIAPDQQSDSDINFLDDEGEDCSQDEIRRNSALKPKKLIILSDSESTDLEDVIVDEAEQETNGNNDERGNDYDSETDVKETDNPAIMDAYDAETDIDETDIDDLEEMSSMSRVVSKTDITSTSATTGVETRPTDGLETRVSETDDETGDELMEDSFSAFETQAFGGKVPVSASKKHDCEPDASVRFTHSATTDSFMDSFCDIETQAFAAPHRNSETDPAALVEASRLVAREISHDSESSDDNDDYSLLTSMQTQAFTSRQKSSCFSNNVAVETSKIVPENIDRSESTKIAPSPLDSDDKQSTDLFLSPNSPHNSDAEFPKSSLDAPQARNEHESGGSSSMLRKDLAVESTVEAASSNRASSVDVVSDVTSPFADLESADDSNLTGESPTATQEFTLSFRSDVTATSEASHPTQPLTPVESCHASAHPVLPCETPVPLLRSRDVASESETLGNSIEQSLSQQVALSQSDVTQTLAVPTSESASTAQSPVTSNSPEDGAAGGDTLSSRTNQETIGATEKDADCAHKDTDVTGERTSENEAGKVAVGEPDLGSERARNVAIEQNVNMSGNVENESAVVYRASCPCAEAEEENTALTSEVAAETNVDLANCCTDFNDNFKNASVALQDSNTIKTQVLTTSSSIVSSDFLIKAPPISVQASTSEKDVSSKATANGVCLNTGPAVQMACRPNKDTESEFHDRGAVGDVSAREEYDALSEEVESSCVAARDAFQAEEYVGPTAEYTSHQQQDTTNINDAGDVSHLTRTSNAQISGSGTSDRSNPVEAAVEENAPTVAALSSAEIDEAETQCYSESCSSKTAFQEDDPGRIAITVSNDVESDTKPCFEVNSATGNTEDDQQYDFVATQCYDTVQIASFASSDKGRRAESPNQSRVSSCNLPSTGESDVAATTPQDDPKTSTNSETSRDDAGTQSHVTDDKIEGRDAEHVTNERQDVVSDDDFMATQVYSSIDPNVGNNHVDSTVPSAGNDVTVTETKEMSICFETSLVLPQELPPTSSEHQVEDPIVGAVLTDVGIAAAVRHSGRKRKANKKYLDSDVDIKATGTAVATKTRGSKRKPPVVTYESPVTREQKSNDVSSPPTGRISRNRQASLVKTKVSSRAKSTKDEQVLFKVEKLGESGSEEIGIKSSRELVTSPPPSSPAGKSSSENVQSRDKPARKRSLRSRGAGNSDIDSNPSAVKKMRSSEDDLPKLSAALALRPRKIKPKVMFTGVVDQVGESIIRDLGGHVTDSVHECTHLITDRIRRTVKFLCAMARGIHIMNTSWLRESKKLGRFVSEENFPLEEFRAKSPPQSDSPPMEAQYNFKLCESLRVARARPEPLFSGFRVHVTKSVLPPPEQMCQILECGGASTIKKMPRATTREKDGGTLLIISTDGDRSACASAIKRGIPIVSAEFVLTGILRQKLQIDDFRLFDAEEEKVQSFHPKRRSNQPEVAVETRSRRSRQKSDRVVQSTRRRKTRGNS